MNPPKPTHLRLLQGNPGNRPVNKQEPKPKVSMPSAPRHLNRHGRAEWRRIVRHLYQLGLVTQIDRAALAMYCQAYGRWVFAEEKIENENHLIIKAPKTDYPIHNPWLSIANRAMRQCHSLLREFGMTPSARSQIRTGEPEAVDPFEDLLRA
jgi:P27 family predicted phage terminase small subunit